MNKTYETFFEANLLIGNKFGFLEGLLHLNFFATNPVTIGFPGVHFNIIKILMVLFCLSLNDVLSNAHFNICGAVEALTYTIKEKL